MHLTSAAKGTDLFNNDNEARYEVHPSPIFFYFTIRIKKEQ